MNIRRLAVTAVVMVGLLSLGWTVVSSAAAKDVPRISKEELKPELGSKNVTLLDVRSGKDWSSSELKIKGAVREDPKDFDTWATKYPKDQKIVLYCA